MTVAFYSAEESVRNLRRRECPSCDCEVALGIITAPFVLEARAIPGGSTKTAFLKRLCLASMKLNQKEAENIIEGLKSFLEEKPLTGEWCGTCSKTAKAVLLLTVLERRMPHIPSNQKIDCSFCPLPGCSKGHNFRIRRENGDYSALISQQVLCATCNDPCEAGEEALKIPLKIPIEKSLARAESCRFPGCSVQD